LVGLEDLFSGYEWSFSEKCIFNPENINKLSNPGGGITVWGGALTKPTSKNNFRSAKAIIKWNLIKKNVTRRSIPRRFRPVDKKLKLLHDFFPKFSFLQKKLLKNFDSMINFYAEGYFSKNPNVKKGLEPHFFGRLLNLKRCADSENRFEFLIEKDGDEVRILATNLVLALGAIPNAFVVSTLLKEKSKFGLGNHFSSEILEIELRRPVPISTMFQTWYPGETKFQTFSLKKNFFPRTNSDPSIRLHPTLFSTQEETDLLLNQAASAYSFLLRRYAREHFKKYGNLNFLVKKFKIQMLIDSPPSNQNFVEFNHDKRLITISQNISPDIVSDLEIALFELKAQIFECRQILSHKLLNQSESWDKSDFHFSDTAHYYGTIPLSDESKINFFPSYQEICEFGIFTFGGSSLPESGSGHPTWLVIRVAECLSKDLLLKERIVI
jgi:hypothetical protein